MLGHQHLGQPAVGRVRVVHLVAVQEEDDVSVLEQDGRTEKVKPFVRDELLKPLENYFFGRSSR